MWPMTILCRRGPAPRPLSAVPARLLCLLVFSVLHWLLPQLTQAEVLEVPPLSARLSDLAQALDASATLELEMRLEAIEREHGAQVAILLVPSTGSEAIEPYALRVAESWQLGREDIDDGILLLVATEDRSVRIEVGYGLEGAVSDIVASRIIHEQMIPLFAGGDYFGGLYSAIDSLELLISGEQLPAPASDGWTMSMEDGRVFMLILFPAIFASLALRSLIGRLWAGLGAATAGGGAAWYFSGAWDMGAFLFLILFAGVALVDAGGGRGSSGSGGGNSSGGFSGGGGSFGGGGSSGRW